MRPKRELKDGDIARFRRATVERVRRRCVEPPLKEQFASQMKLTDCPGLRRRAGPGSPDRLVECK